MILRSLAILAASLLITSCQFTPSAMPSGYTYLHDKYKSPPSPEADDIGYEYSISKNSEVVARWGDIAAVMIDSLENRADISPKILFLKQPSVVSPQNSTFDHALRKELQERGYLLSDTAKDSIALHYSIDKIEDFLPEYPYPTLEIRANKPDYKTVDDHAEEMRLNLSLTDGETVLITVEEDHLVPTYGYEHEYTQRRFFDNVSGRRHPKPAKPLFMIEE